MIINISVKYRRTILYLWIKRIFSVEKKVYFDFVFRGHCGLPLLLNLHWPSERACQTFLLLFFAWALAAAVLDVLNIIVGRTPAILYTYIERPHRLQIVVFYFG